jgi:hypothetical protein
MLDSVNDLKVYNKENKEKEKWVVYYIYAKIKDELKAIYIGITSQLSYVKLRVNEYIINEFNCIRFSKHKRDLNNNIHNNFFLQDLHNKGVEFIYKVCSDKVYKTKREAKQVENTLISNQNEFSCLLNINGLTLQQLEKKRLFYNSYILMNI